MQLSLNQNAIPMNMSTVLETMPSAVEITDLKGAEFDEVLTPDALRFIENLHNKFEDRRQALLRARKHRQADLDKGIFPEFNPESAYIRTSRWQVAPVKDELNDRRIELVGSVDVSSVIQGLNSEANIFVADFEDYTSPTWDNLMNGQRNLMKAIRGTLSRDTDEGKLSLQPSTTAIFVRPRGLHLEEKHVLINDRPVSASLVDFGLFFFHNAARLIDKGSAPYFYLPKIESHNEARWWNQVFMFSQYHLGIPQGTIKASILIENILAAFEMHEILYEIRDHSAGLSCGKWDYIFSFIRKFRKYTSLVLPDRSQLSMKSPFLNAFQRLLIDTCHRRNTVAIGSSSSLIVVEGEEKQNKMAMEGLRKEKRQEILAGHDGTWLSNPMVINEVMEEFEMHMEGVDQKHVQFEEFQIQAEDMMTLPLGKITEAGITKKHHHLAPVLERMVCRQRSTTLISAA